MKFILTIDWSLINANEISEIVYQRSEFSTSFSTSETLYSYFVLKNGNKFDAYDSPSSFVIDGVNYYFDKWCHKTYNVLLLKDILYRLEDMHVYCIEKYEDDIWQYFINECKCNLDQLTEKVKPTIDFN